MLYSILKRFLDIIGSLLGLLIITPFTPFIALAIKLDSRGPVFVKLPRVSKGKTIMVYKFRSMIANAQLAKEHLKEQNERKDGPFFKIKKDPRVTRVGRFLRKLKLDEFPQLFNVLTGKLSLVGPRPHEPEEVLNYPFEYRHLTLAKAGATGLSQVSGASNLPFLKELELDNYYINRRSLWMDLKIIFKTILILLTDPNGI
ncbi:MAG: sugar transferase [Candidatus Pacebacteria bacterium]|nr:sugar transferase [Candidatus Paceibacterota bacterium]